MLRCPICISTFQSPFVTPCGHSFCHPCITKVHIYGIIHRNTTQSCLYNIYLFVEWVVVHTVCIPPFPLPPLTRSRPSLPSSPSPPPSLPSSPSPPPSLPSSPSPPPSLPPQHLAHQSSCPICFGPLSTTTIFPNLALDNVARLLLNTADEPFDGERATAPQPRSTKTLDNTNTTTNTTNTTATATATATSVADLIKTLAATTDIADLDAALATLQERKRDLDAEDDVLALKLLAQFLEVWWCDDGQGQG